MDLQNQQRIKDAAEKYGGENVVVILGSSDAEGAEIYAETVSNGDPTYAGPLAGVQLGLPVYHIFDDVVRKECDPIAWDEQVNMMEMVLDTDKLASAVKGIRDQYSKFAI
jgi:betaine reductase